MLYFWGCGYMGKDKKQFDKAEKLFNEQQYENAYQEYVNMVIEFPKSKLYNESQIKLEKCKEILAQRYLSLANKYFEDKNYKKAISHYEKSWFYDPSNPEVTDKLKIAREEELVPVEIGKEYYCKDCGKVYDKKIEKTLLVKRKEMAKYKLKRIMLKCEKHKIPLILTDVEFMAKWVGYMHLTGDIKNIGNKNIEGIKIKAVFIKGDEVLGDDSSYVPSPSTPLGPGQKYHFSLRTEDNPAFGLRATKCRLYLSYGGYYDSRNLGCIASIGQTGEGRYKIYNDDPECDNSGVKVENDFGNYKVYRIEP